ncbi:MAG: QVPTGV class sortase B protein-sorting domain-containing protein [Oscillospiraceae bacterium]|nr:QVPTGV class sortase B protein-sorting domain-containing protein [Oscillospiraceae bacterium]
MNKKFSKFFALALALILCMAMAAPALAFEYDHLEVSADTPKNSTTFDKYLVLEDGARVPDVTFAFKIEPGVAVEAKNGNYEIKAGPMNADRTKPSVENAVFTNGQGTTTDGGKTYATSTVKVDFTGVTFEAPGVYRYKITETTENGNGITVDGAPRYLDVVVVDDTKQAAEKGELKIESYFLLNTAANIIDGENGEKKYDGEKSSGFTNSMETFDLTVSKTVAGNQGNKEDTFEFTLKIEGGNEGDTYNANLNGSPITITLDENGEYKFTLGHNDSLTVTGLNYGTKWTVTEDAKDYTPSVTVTDDDEDATGTGNSASDKVTGITADTTAAFTNTKDGVISTGILLTVAPFAALMLVGIVGAALIIKKKSKAV